MVYALDECPKPCGYFPEGNKRSIALTALNCGVWIRPEFEELTGGGEAAAAREPAEGVGEPVGQTGELSNASR